MNVEQDLNEIINEIKGGNKDYARELLRNFIKDNPTNEKGWWIYANVPVQRFWTFCNGDFRHPN